MKPVTLKEILSVSEFEERARACLPASTYEYLASGAADEHTVRWNREAYDLIKLRPRVLRDVATVDTTLTLLGQKLESPVLLAPTAFLRAIHPDGEIAVARGAGAAGATWIVSTATTTPLEEIAPEATSPLWFQLYVQRDRSVTKDLVQRAEGVGCKALCLTVDTAVQGPRNRQTRSKFALPAGLSAPYMSELVAGRKIADNKRGNVVTWDDVEWLQSVARTPLLIKGILDADDAERAVAAGVSGVIVSNHGGRNLDTAPATIDALPEVAARVSGRVPVLVDGGIRRGTDI
ncbi:MAG: alpha-hydroxy acid oxidase, partial [Thermoanaerobaculia bacterium]